MVTGMTVEEVNKKGQSVRPASGYKYYSDSNFQVGDSPVVLDIRTDLGRDAVSGWITCDGSGDILIELMDEAGNYGQQYLIKKKDVENLDGGDSPVRAIRITHSGTDSSYRVRVV
jgi:hypothetical protein